MLQSRSGHTHRIHLQIHGIQIQLIQWLPYRRKSDRHGPAEAPLGEIRRHIQRQMLDVHQPIPRIFPTGLNGISQSEQVIFPAISKALRNNFTIQKSRCERKDKAEEFTHRARHLPNNDNERKLQSAGLFGHPHRTGLVGWLAAVGVEGAVGQGVDVAVVHGEEDLPGLDRGADAGPGFHLAAEGLDLDPIAGGNVEGFGVVRMNFQPEVGEGGVS